MCGSSVNRNELIICLCESGNPFKLCRWGYDNNLSQNTTCTLFQYVTMHKSNDFGSTSSFIHFYLVAGNGCCWNSPACPLWCGRVPSFRIAYIITVLNGIWSWFENGFSWLGQQELFFLDWKLWVTLLSLYGWSQILCSKLAHGLQLIYCIL